MFFLFNETIFSLKRNLKLHWQGIILFNIVTVFKPTNRHSKGNSLKFGTHLHLIFEILVLIINDQNIFKCAYGIGWWLIRVWWWWNSIWCSIIVKGNRFKFLNRHFLDILYLNYSMIREHQVQIHAYWSALMTPYL